MLGLSRADRAPKVLVTDMEGPCVAAAADRLRDEACAGPTPISRWIPQVLSAQARPAPAAPTLDVIAVAVADLATSCCLRARLGATQSFPRVSPFMLPKFLQTGSPRGQGHPVGALDTSRRGDAPSSRCCTFPADEEGASCLAL